MKFLRPRNFVLVGGTLLVMLFLYLTDPNGGALTATLAAQLATPVVAVWFAFLSRKALFDYADMLELYNKAKETALGAAIIFVSMCIIMFALLGLFGNQLKAAEYIPTKALIYIPVLKVEQQALWVNHPKPFYSLAQ